MFKVISLVLLLGFFNLSAQSNSTPINQIQILASHNSYKKFPDQRVIRFLTRFKKQLGSANDPIQLDYGHLPLSQQFDEYNIRGIEIDINYDPKGGLYRKRKLNMFLFGKRQKVKDPKMKLPGFKVLHIADVDYETNYLTFIEVLQELKNWSQAHPKHNPIFVNIEAKGSNPADESKFLKLLGFKKSIPFDEIAYKLLDDEIYSILSKEMILSPFELKSNYNSIEERLKEKGWPTMDEVAGKIFFILEGNNDQLYLSGQLSRPMFVYGKPGEENTAFVIINDPIGHENEIQSLTKQYMVRTRSDSGTIEARNNDYKRFQAAKQSGAQIISTDYYKPDLRLSTFKIKF